MHCERGIYAYETVLIVENHISEICEWRDRKIYESEIERDRDKDRMESRERERQSEKEENCCMCLHRCNRKQLENRKTLKNR